MAKYIALSIIGFSGGVLIAGGVFAFIVILGVVPRLAQKTKTYRFITLYEDYIILGGILGTLTLLGDVFIPLGIVFDIAFGLFSGIFVGCLAVSLAEVIDVIPILSRRIGLKVGMRYFLLAIAIGKLVGSLIYFIIPGLAVFK